MKSLSTHSMGGTTITTRQLIKTISSSTTNPPTSAQTQECVARLRHPMMLHHQLYNRNLSKLLCIRYLGLIPGKLSTVQWSLPAAFMIPLSINDVRLLTPPTLDVNIRTFDLCNGVTSEKQRDIRQPQQHT